jgi:hypothetical protein
MAKELTPELSTKGEAPLTTGAPGSHLPGFSCPSEDPNTRAAWRRYEEYINSAVWGEKCRRVLDRAVGRCEGCGVPGMRLEVHHLTYEHLGDERLDELKALCPECHKKADEERRAEMAAAIRRRWEEEREEEHFERWARKFYGEDFFDSADYDDLRDARERFDEWASDRDGEDFE